MSPDPTAVGDAGADPTDRPGAVRWLVFGLVCAAYLVATTGEQLLSPVFPSVKDDLDLTVGQGGIAFALLSGSIAACNVLGGWLLRRMSPVALIARSCAVGAVGSLVTALAPGYGVLLVGQVLLGSSAGLFFPSGLQSVGLAAPAHRRGFAMGIYGVAFSLGLTMAAVLGTIGSSWGWRTPFWISVALFAASAVGCAWIRLPAPTSVAHLDRVPIRTVLSLPTAVGTVLAVCQYGAVPFLTTFAVLEWGITPSEAATVLIVGRLLSILAKLIGGASADRIGARRSARRTGIVLAATGVLWVTLPGSIAVYGIAAVYAGGVSTLGPVANTLAVERFGQNGMALGMYRSIQIALGALSSAIVGLVADQFGLRVTLAVATAATPLMLLYICREPSGATSSDSSDSSRSA